MLPASYPASGRLALTLVALAACGGSRPAVVHAPVPQPLNTEALVGVPVVVLPATMVVVEPGVPPAGDRAALLAWADSLVGAALQDRAPEVRWVLPPELRRVARRSPGLVADPDQMGQAVLRQSSFRVVPDPLRGSLRTLLAVAGGGRHALVPAAIVLSPLATGGVRARLSAVLADGRSGAILWRTEVDGEGLDASTALATALATILPLLQP